MGRAPRHVRNATRQTVVARRAQVADGPLRRLVGLIGRDGWSDADGLLIRSCNSIHTCFMRMPIDVVFVDRHGVVLDVVPERPPWRCGPVKWRAAWVLELRAGAIASSATCLDDRLVVERVVWADGPGGR